MSKFKRTMVDTENKVISRFFSRKMVKRTIENNDYKIEVESFDNEIKIINSKNSNCDNESDKKLNASQNVTFCSEENIQTSEDLRDEDNYLFTAHKKNKRTI